jgi:hypothetical protein
MDESESARESARRVAYWAFQPDDRILALERKRIGCTVEQQAAAMGLDRRDLYRALKRKLPLTSVKKQRFDAYVTNLARSFMHAESP